MKSSLLLEFPNNPPSSFKGLEFFLDHEVGLKIKPLLSPLTTSEGALVVGETKGGSLSGMHAEIWLG
jgi:hypothetical protein